MDNVKNDEYYIQKVKKDVLFIVTHSDIPWTALAGLRNRIVHDYGNVDLNIVYETLKNDMPELLKMLEAEHMDL